MKLNEVKDFTKGVPKHPEIKLPNFLDNKDWSKMKVSIRDAIIRDSKTGKIYGRRAIVQRVDDGM